MEHYSICDENDKKKFKIPGVRPKDHTAVSSLFAYLHLPMPVVCPLFSPFLPPPGRLLLIFYLELLDLTLLLLLFLFPISALEKPERSIVVASHLCRLRRARDAAHECITSDIFSFSLSLSIYLFLSFFLSLSCAVSARSSADLISRSLVESIRVYISSSFRRRHGFHHRTIFIAV